MDITQLHIAIIFVAGIARTATTTHAAASRPPGPLQQQQRMLARHAPSRRSAREAAWQHPPAVASRARLVACVAAISPANTNGVPTGLRLPSFGSFSVPAATRPAPVTATVAAGRPQARKLRLETAGRQRSPATPRAGTALAAHKAALAWVPPTPRRRQPPAAAAPAACHALMKAPRTHVCHFPGCSYVGKKKSHLVQHLTNLHTPARLFKCGWPGCDYAAKRKITKIEHERTHTGVRPYRCTHPGCGYSSAQRTTLTSHIRRTHLVTTVAAINRFVAVTGPLGVPAGPPPPAATRRRHSAPLRPDPTSAVGRTSSAVLRGLGALPWAYQVEVVTATAAPPAVATPAVPSSPEAQEVMLLLSFAGQSGSL